MDLTLIVAVAVVVVSSAAVLAVGAAYKWQVTSRGYGLWTRGIGVVTILVLSGVTIWSRRSDTLAAVLIGVGGVALAAGYLWLHLRLTKNLRDAGVESPL